MLRRLWSWVRGLFRRRSAPALPARRPMPDVVGPFFKVRRVHDAEMQILYAGHSGAEARRVWESVRHATKPGVYQFLHDGVVRATHTIA